eukprot:6996871-Alexandrium_andersonii.AAC.1
MAGGDAIARRRRESPAAPPEPLTAPFGRGLVPSIAKAPSEAGAKRPARAGDCVRPRCAAGAKRP